MSRKMRKKIFLLTYCRNLELLWSSTLVFDSLRIGFPEADVFVYDNQSLPDARAIIHKKTRDCGGYFHPLDTEVLHQDFIEDTLRTQAGTVIFIDPDVCFWKNCEG